MQRRSGSLLRLHDEEPRSSLDGEDSYTMPIVLSLAVYEAWYE